ncbi:MAG: tRNA (adenosine(37)-N6)-dimethylallyltransferase MiaA [Candidatus Eisenbacteria bacterium]
MAARGPLPFVLAGATGAGKTAVALELAACVGGEVVCADARQVYRGLAVATGKPTVDERARVPHHGFDVLDPREPSSAGSYARRTGALLAGLTARGRVPLLVGGSGLYLRASHSGLAEVPEIDADIRTRVRERLATEGAPLLHAELTALDPPLAGRLAPGDGQRIARGLEVVLATGRPLSDWQDDATSDPAPWFWVVLSRPRAHAQAALGARARAFFEQGLVDEVRGLLATGIPAEAPALDALGYREALEVLAGRMGVEAAIEDLTRHTIHYAKRQATWWRGEARRVTIVFREIGPHESPGQVARELADLHARESARAHLAGSGGVSR